MIFGSAPLITEDWLRDCGFKWEQHDRQPEKHWVLWIGLACLDYDRTVMPDSLGIALSKVPDNILPEYQNLWHCWIRNDVAGRYSRIIHVRYVYLQSEVESVIEALTGRKLDWRNSLYGNLYSPKQGEQLRQDRLRLDQRINHAWVERVDQEKGVKSIDKDKRGVVLP